MRTRSPFIFAILCLSTLGSALMAGDPTTTNIKINTNDFCGYWRFTAPGGSNQPAPSGTLGESCDIRDIGQEKFIYGPCEVSLESDDYTFEIKAIQNPVQVNVSPQNGVTLKSPALDLALEPKTSPQGDHSLDILTTEIAIQSGGFQGNISFEYIARPTECPNHQTTLPKGAKWYLTVGSHANTLITLDRYGIAYATSQSAIRTRTHGSLTRLQFKTVDVTVTPDSNAPEWDILGVIKTPQVGPQTISLVPAGSYQLRAKIGGIYRAAFFKLTGDCEVWPNTLFLPDAGLYYLSANCASSGFDK